MRERSSNTSGMGTRKRKFREDDQLDEDAVWQESKRQAVQVEVAWSSSPDRWAQRVAEEVLSSSTTDANSDLEPVLLDGLSIGKDDQPGVVDEIILTSEDPDTSEEANKENADGGQPSISPNVETGEHSCKSSQSDKEIPSALSPWLLTPPSLSTQTQQLESLSSETVYGSPPRMPLPSGLDWADSSEVWDILVKKDRHWGTLRNPNYFSTHPSLEPRMRSILLDWLMEVCEVYKLHRETYYLAQDFIDRFLSDQQNVPKQQLQLIGITCLFIAAKVEEIYPPKISEFAYVTDGACDENEILEKELIILKALKWDLSSVTINSWLTIFLQLYGQDGTETKDDDDELAEQEREMVAECSSVGKQRGEMTLMRHSRRRRGRRRSFLPNTPSNILKPPSGSTFVFPQFPGIALVRAAFLSDFATLDAGALKFPYSVIATSTIYHTLSKEIALSVSGFRFADIKLCVDWMSAFVIELKESGAMAQLPAQLESVWTRLGLGTSGDGGTRGSALLKTIPRLVVDDSHNIQTHLVDLDLLEKAQERLSRLSSSKVATPPLVLTLSTSSSPTSSRDTDESSPAKSLALLTPPASSVKSLAGSSSIGNVNITPSTASTSYHSADFCVG
ncbi:G1/S-specific cyclin-E1 [Hetaerina americana]|uniref:G1/S-specific cyclin-E1 n=1 Tax=Hetaerina americana TaxID=62018 RepID=UPI003A7F10FA